MIVMEDIFWRVLFLIGVAGLGWIAGTVLKVGAKDISSLLVYIVSPLVIFLAIVQSPADWTYFSYSLGALLTASLAAGLAFGLGRVLWRDGRANLFAFAGGTGNTGYFALPLVFALFDGQQAAIAAFIIIGVNLYEFTVGYFITARGILNTRSSLLGIARLPIIYAALAGVLCKSVGWAPGELLGTSLANFKGAYSVLGMMVIGITFASCHRLRLDWDFLLAALSWKHLIYPMAGLAVFHLLVPLPQEAWPVVALMLATPMAANTVVIANVLDVHPEKAASAVMASTVLALATVPLMVSAVAGWAG